LRLNSFDVPPVATHAQSAVDAAGPQDRIRVVSGDFMRDALPEAEIVTIGNVLHDWNLDDKLTLIRRAYDALPEGGVFIAIEKR
jgi:O-methyltransferase domain